MEDVFIDEHALKHGIGADDIAFAWEHFVALQHRGAPKEGEIVAVGFDTRGRFIQMVAVVKPYGTLVIHAMEPPTLNVLRELGLERGQW